MSLLQLLTTGKSLVGLDDSESRYRESRQRFLPRFGPVRNVFRAADQSDSARPAADMATEEASASNREKAARAGSPSPARDASEARSLATSRLPMVLVSSSRRTFMSALRSRAATSLNKWMGKLSTLLSRPGGKPVRAGMPRLAKLPVQGELSLDSIKVVRNDLSDTDLEVVPAKLLAPPRGVAPVLRRPEGAGAGGTAWGRLAGRVFRAGKT